MFPVRVRPLPGESIDSWLYVCAHSMEMTMRELARRLELQIDARPRWRLKLSRNQLQAIQRSTGAEPSVVKTMTLDTYDGSALGIDAATRTLDATFPFGALDWSRYCPHCLAGSMGRWRLYWRLGWAFACIEHRCLLADCCPDCEARQRRQVVYHSVPRPMHCACGRALSSVSTQDLQDGHAIISAQQRVLGIISSRKTNFGLYRERPVVACVALRDVRSLANRVLNYASAHGLEAVKMVDTSPLQLRKAPSDARLPARFTLTAKAPLRSIDTAVGVTAALGILRGPDIVTAGVRARWLFAGQNADTGSAELRSCARDSDTAAAIAIRAAGPL